MIKRMRRCPFCGSGEARLFILPFSGDYDSPWGWFVSCETSDYGCGASGPVRLTKDEAVEAWNTRPIFDSIKDRVQDIYDDGGTYDDLEALREITKIVMEEDDDTDE